MPVLLLYVAVFAGGMLTIFSPCILPVLPFVLPRAGRPFRSETLPLLAGLVAAFVFVAIVGTAGAAWVAAAADGGRVLALVLLTTAGAALLSPRLASRITRPLVRIGERLSIHGSAPSSRVGPPVRAFVLGVATGMVWAPCAGPILGLVAAGAATGASPTFAAALFATFGAGAALALAIGVFSGSRVLKALRGLFGGGADVWARRALGAAAVATAVIIATGNDASVFASRGIVQTTRAEEAVLRRLVPRREAAFAGSLASARPPVPTPDEGPLPTFAGGTGWLNTGGHGQPLSADQLRGKVVVVNVWTFACYNCLNALPHIKSLAAKYRDQDVVVVGVHTPELARERVPDNVAQAVERLGVTYPVVLDANYSIWRAFHNEYWPSVYIADRNGRIRYHHFGEGAYDDEDRVVAQLLAEPAAAAPSVKPRAPGGPAQVAMRVGQ
jgi:cytochrome c biogenesis protein CcdA/thiol-disulfide isomerase/thioredoxin